MAEAGEAELRPVEVPKGDPNRLTIPSPWLPAEDEPTHRGRGLLATCRVGRALGGRPFVPVVCIPDADCSIGRLTRIPNGLLLEP